MPPRAKRGADPSDFPFFFANGSINKKKFFSPPILLNNTTGKISVEDNIFYLNNLNTSTLEGTVGGDISANLLSMLLTAKVNGRNINVEKAFYELMNMKDTLTGTVAFNTDLVINGAAKTQEEQMKGIKGDINFEIKDGQLGPFGRLENIILAENIRESEFFQTALGGVIDSVTYVPPSHFSLLDGHI